MQLRIWVEDVLELSVEVATTLHPTDPDTYDMKETLKRDRV